MMWGYKRNGPAGLSRFWEQGCLRQGRDFIVNLSATQWLFYTSSVKGSQSGSQCKKNMPGGERRAYVSMVIRCHRLLTKIAHHCEKYRHFIFMIHFLDKHWFKSIFDFQWLRKFTCLFWKFPPWLQEEITVKCNMGTSVWNDRNNEENKWFSLRRDSALATRETRCNNSWKVSNTSSWTTTSPDSK